MKFTQLYTLIRENQKTIDEMAHSKGFHNKAFHGTSSKWKAYEFGKRATDAPDEAIYLTDSHEEAIIAGSPNRNKSIVMELFYKAENPFIVDAKGTEKDRSFGKAGYRKLIALAKAKGHDSAIIKNIIDFGDSPQTTIIIFNPSSIKSSDSVTYDDNNIEIPLSQRFDVTKDDIRY